MFVAKQFDIVMGVDIHIIQPPGPVPPVPIPHPFIGMVMDPSEFTPKVGSSIFVKGIPRAQAGTLVKNTTPHIPIGGTFVKPPSNEGVLHMGSLTVIADSQPFSYNGLPVLTCQDSGRTAPERSERKSSSKPKGMLLPTSILLVIPKGDGLEVAPNPSTEQAEVKKCDGDKCKYNPCSKECSKTYDENHINKKGRKGTRPKPRSIRDTVKGKYMGRDDKLRCAECNKRGKKTILETEQILVEKTKKDGTKMIVKQYQWVMGHEPPDAFKDNLKELKECKITKDEFLKKEKDPNKFQPECYDCSNKRLAGKPK